MILNTEYAIIQIPILGYNPPDVIPLLTNLKIALNFMERVNVCKSVCNIFTSWMFALSFPLPSIVKPTGKLTPHFS